MLKEHGKGGKNVRLSRGLSTISSATMQVKLKINM
jgi:hypothetical protein